MSGDLENNEIQFGDRKFGEKTPIRLTVKTLLIIILALYPILGYLYYDLRQEIKDSVQISKQEKENFLREVDEDWESKLDKIEDIITDIRLDQSDMKGDIKVILDRQLRSDQPASSGQPSVEIDGNLPPGN